MRKEGITGKDKRESVTRIEGIFKSLSVDVGVRLAGSEGEKLAAEFIRGELAGRDKNSGIIVVGGHHDTQAGSPGADDNGTGTVAVIELTRLFASKAPFRRTIRLISFGAEEQLSVGSANYVRRHRADRGDRCSISGFLLLCWLLYL
ncbi:MAG: M28 family peptidase [Spirochaetales bacterium]|nr:M28 family peptidase [Spirochaetales bacterium]